jgi:hypothetical protein
MAARQLNFRGACRELDALEGRADKSGLRATASQLRELRAYLPLHQNRPDEILNRVAGVKESIKPHFDKRNGEMLGLVVAAPTNFTEDGERIKLYDRIVKAACTGISRLAQFSVLVSTIPFIAEQFFGVKIASEHVAITPLKLEGVIIVGTATWIWAKPVLQGVFSLGGILPLTLKDSAKEAAKKNADKVQELQYEVLSCLGKVEARL